MHDFASDSICSQVLWSEILSISGVEVSLLLLCFDGISSFLHFSSDGVGNLALHHISLASNAGDSGRRMLGRPILSVVGGHDLGLALAIDSIGGVIKHLVCLNWVVKVMVSLWNVLLGDSPKQNKDGKYQFMTYTLLTERCFFKLGSIENP